jgi:hypothetical protein
VEPQNLTPFVVGALFIFAMYRRVRRNFGPQPVRERALMVRAGLLAVIGSISLYFSARDASLLMALAGGLAAGVVLGTIGLRHTQFQISDKGRFYTPHTYIGLFVTSLFLFRIIARYVSIHANSVAGAGTPQDPLTAYRNPLTLAVLGVLVGYYVYFNIGVFRRSRGQLSSMAPTTPTQA